jgi:hypothetical protein
MAVATMLGLVVAMHPNLITTKSWSNRKWKKREQLLIQSKRCNLLLVAALALDFGA